MLTRWKWPLALAVGMALLIVAGVAAYLLLLPRQSDDIPIPDAGATPGEVVTAYLDALDAHDCDTAEAVMTSDAAGIASQWCRNIASLDDVVVRDHVAERPEWSGHSAPDEVVRVPVTFDLRWRPFHDDVSMPEGVTSWGYYLVRDSPDAPWRIFSNGHG